MQNPTINLKNQYSLHETELVHALENCINKFKKNNDLLIEIPLTAFNMVEGGILENLSVYLREKKNLNFHNIARLINRDERTIWTAYTKATNKNKKIHNNITNQINVPLRIFFDRKYSPLEALVSYLKENHYLTFKQIAFLLNRKYHNIWLTYNNYLLKGGENG